MDIVILLAASIVGMVLSVGMGLAALSLLLSLMGNGVQRRISQS